MSEAIEDAEDRAALAALDRQEAALGRERARGRYLTAEEVQRLCGGASPLAVWRGKRGLTQIALAHLAGVAPSNVADIERGQSAAVSRCWRSWRPRSISRRET